MFQARFFSNFRKYLQRSPSVLNSRDISARSSLAQSYLFVIKNNEALKVVNEALRIDPSSPSSAIQKFFTLLSLGDSAAAAAVSRMESVRLNSSDRGQMAMELALVRHDARGIVAGAREARFGLGWADGSGTSMYSTIAAIARITGDRATARGAADTAVVMADSVTRIARQRVGDPFGTAAIADGNAAIAQAAAGDSGRAVARLERAMREFTTARDGVDGPMMNKMAAIVYMLAGRQHDAVAQLKTAIAVPQIVTYGEVRMSLLWDPLRANPEFKALLAGLPK